MIFSFELSEFTGREVFPPTLTLPLREAVKKSEYFPLTLPSAARGEGKHIEIEKKFPPPRRGRERVGVVYGIFSHLQRGEGRIEVR